MCVQTPKGTNTKSGVQSGQELSNICLRPADDPRVAFRFFPGLQILLDCLDVGTTFPNDEASCSGINRYGYDFVSLEMLAIRMPLKKKTNLPTTS